MQKNPKGVSIHIEEDESGLKQKPISKAIPFITYDEKKGFVLNKEAEDVLRSRPEERKIGVISIVGKYRTGKSFFTNRVLLNHSGKGGFTVGPTVNPCTKGLWIWDAPLQSVNPEYPDMDIFLIDTEGFGGTDENVNHDSRIFLFSLLLSSYFIYNSVGNIDENALNALSLIINLAKDIQLKTGKTTKDQDPAQFFPSFLWVVRDFTLKLVDLEGKQLAPKEYLEKALELQKGVSDAIESKNRIRKLLLHFFKDRDCITFVRPLEDENQLQKLDETPDESLRPEFVEQMNKARNKIFTKIKPKTLNGNVFTGGMLVELINAYLNAINSGQVPNIEHAFQYMMKNESKKAFQDTLMKVEKELTEYLKSPLAQDKDKMKDLKKRLEEDAIKNFKKKALGEKEDLQEYVSEISNKLNENFKKVKEKNLENWKNVYQEFSAPFIEEIEKKLKNDGYSNYYEFQIEFNKFKEKFEKEAPNGPEKSNFLKQLSENVYSTAAEYISKKTEVVLGRETMRLKKKIEETEDDLDAKKKNWEKDKEELEKKLNSIERERAQSKMVHETWKEKYEKIVEEKKNLERMYNDLVQKAKDVEINASKSQQENTIKLERKLETIKSEHDKIIMEYEKKLALSGQEITFAKKEGDSVNSKIKSLEKENHRLKEEIRKRTNAEDDLRKKLNDVETSKTQELTKQQLEYEKQIQELKKKRRNSSEDDDDEFERPKKMKMAAFPQQYPNWLEEKIKLENEVNFLKGKLEEGQKVQDAFRMAIEHGVNFNDNENIQTLNNCELVETNKNLSLSLEKAETRARAIQDKLEKSKTFKKMINNCSSLQCLHCSQNILIALFIQHLISCAKIEISGSPYLSTLRASKDNYATPSKQHSQPIIIQKETYVNSNYEREKMKKAGNSTTRPEEKIENISNSVKKTNEINDNNEEINISIAQTLIKEGSDHKPFIEYLIYCKKLSQKWMVSRKYKDFCELHQILIGMFPGYQFPNSSKILLNSFNDFNSLKDLKTPKILDERKVVLEIYLQEIATSIEIRNCSPFKQFLGVDGRQLSNDFIDDYIDDNKIQKNNSNEDNGKQPFLSSFKIDKKMLPESPESFLKNWEGGKSSNNNSNRKYVSKTPEKNQINSFEKINEVKDLYRNLINPSNGDNNNNDNKNTTTFVYDCGHSLSGNLKGNNQLKRINAKCPGCSGKKNNINNSNGSGKNIRI